MINKTKAIINKVEYLEDGQDCQVDIIVDGGWLRVFIEIVLEGKYNRTIKILSGIENVHERSIIVDGHFLIIGVSTNFVVYDLDLDKVIINKELHTWADDCIKLGNGYFVHGELENFYFDSKFNLVWKYGCADIFENTKMDDVVEIGDDYVAVFDWYGIKRYYNESGEYKEESYPQLSMDRN